MGSADRVIRTVLAIMVAVLYATHVISGTIGLILLVVALVFLLTSFFSSCPLYTLVGINTCKTKP